MKWFKFYGKDWLTDMKIMSMSVEDKLCFLTLLCLAANDDDPGVIKNCNEESIIKLTNLYEDSYDDNNEATRARGFLKRLNDNEMITIDNNGDVTLLNFQKRQDTNLSGYERVKRHREKHKTDNKAIKPMITNDNADDNVMITPKRKKERREKIRLDREEEKREDLSSFKKGFFYDGKPIRLYQGKLWVAGQKPWKLFAGELNDLTTKP